ncbi:V-type ATP synthase subunit E family protein [Petrotoga sp. 9PWA.NaAc.5.4]|uniref:V-type ATP synthase subunit E family protein n=1 Tax=Petrotoga sp. 9PWA.NaAc.5.4 TaxID=1434328 RepID=UPI000CACE3C7|nr:V-type ATP synthase subunit E family protein [Petrotoga sp. 9PWA.NaAc.5.4]PNR92576.1 hypothetical protein X924_09710 [Petrotoga sp. 9PWA.NaAc.5.4]
MNEINDKLENMLKLLDNKFKEEYQKLESYYQQKLEEAQKNIEEEIKNYEKQKIEEARQKAENIIKTAQAKYDLRIRQERSKRKNDLIEDILELIKNELLNLEPSKKKLFYQKLYLSAENLVEENFTVLCNKNDYEIVKSIVLDHNVQVEENIEGGIILQSRHFSINNTISSYFEENKNEIVRLVLEEVGDI